MENLTEQEFIQAWESGCLVYPATPKAHDQRWFLRTAENCENHSKILFVGINPSTATRFAAASKVQGGDPTTAAILKRFPVDDRQRPINARWMSIINLIPLVGQGCQLPDWNSLSGENEILSSLKITITVMKLIVPEADHIILMWGNPKDSKFPWKRDIIPIVQELIRTFKKPNAAVKAVYSENAPYYPTHPAYGRWNGHEFCDALHLLEHE